MYLRCIDAHAAAAGCLKFPNLSLLFNPRSIAFVGASDRPGSIAQRALENLLQHSAFAGSLYLVNPKRSSLYDRYCYPSVSELPESPDLAILTTPAEAVVPALRECAAKGVQFAIVFTAGFGEVGDEGKALEASMKALASSTGMRIYGPNTPGLTNVVKRLGFAFSPAFRTDLRAGSIGLATQGGALGRTFMQSMDRGLGVAVWCSGGNEVDLEISDFIHHMVEDSDIKVIAAIVEGARDGARFIAAALSAVHRGKPLAVLKIGKSSSGIAAVQSHTAAISGAAEVNSAVFRQLGIIEANDLDELADVVSLLAQRQSRGDEKIAIYSLSGGSAALTADMTGLLELPLAEFSAETTQALRALLPSYASINNPLDISGNVLSTPEILYPSLMRVVTDANVAVTIFPIPLDYGSFIATVCEVIVKVQRETQAIIVPVWMSDRTGAGYAKLIEAGLVPIRSLRNAALAIERWRNGVRTRQAVDLHWAPVRLTPPAPETIYETITEVTAKAWMAAEGIPVLQGRLCSDMSQVRDAVAALGTPLVAKIVSPQITHKSDLGGVRIDIATADEACMAFSEILASVNRHQPDATIDGVLFEQMAPRGGTEVFIGVHRDPVFGLIMTFGLGGIFVELFNDVSRRMLPITAAGAAAMIRGTRCFGLLNGQRGRPAADLEALERCLVTVSEFVVKRASSIKEFEINPIWVGPVGQGVFALDAVLTIARQPR